MSATPWWNLSEVADINPPLTSSPRKDDTVSFIPMAAVSEAGMITKSVDRRYLDVSKGYTAFERGDILVAKITPCFENGKIARADIERPIGVGSTEFHVVRPRSGVLEPAFLLHFLRQDWVRLEGERKMTGSAGQRRVPAHFLASLRIPFTRASDQRRIAAILDQADALRAKRRAAMSLLDAVAQSVFGQMFGPSTARDALDDCAQIASGVALGRRLRGPLATVPYVRVANVQAGFLDLSEVKTVDVLPHEARQLRLEKGDVLLTEGGDFDKLGRAALWTGQIEGCIHQNHVFRVRADRTKLLPRFFHEYLQTSEARGYFLKCAKRTSNLATINMTQLRALPVPIPCVARQAVFVERAEAIAGLRVRLVASLSQLDALFASLQHRAFRGGL